VGIYMKKNLNDIVSPNFYR